MRRVGAWSRVAVAAMAGSVSPVTGRAYGVARVCAVWGVPLLAAIGAGNRVRSAPSGATPPRACAPRSSAGPARAAPPPTRRSAPSPRSGVSRLGISEASILGRPSTNGCPRKRGPAHSRKRSSMPTRPCMRPKIPGAIESFCRSDKSGDGCPPGSDASPSLILAPGFLRGSRHSARPEISGATTNT